MVRLPASLSKGIGILLLGKNFEQTQKIEFRTELDDDFSRMQVYTAQTINDAKKLAREKQIHLSIIEDGVEGRDYVFTQFELQNAAPKIQIIPIVQILNLVQIRESQRSGSLYELTQENVLSNYDLFKSYVQRFIRDKANQDASDEKNYEFFKSLSNTLEIAQKTNTIDRLVTRKILAQLVSYYDFNFEENLQLSMASMIYTPHFTAKDFEKILPSKHEEIIQILSQSGSWILDTKPQSAHGLVLTLASYMSSQIELENNPILEVVKSRPNFLKHPAIRTMSEDKILDVLSSFELTTARYNYGS